MLYGPVATDGTVTVHVNAPSAATDTVPSLHEKLVPPKCGVTTSPAVNPEPDNTTLPPTSPFEGLNVRAGLTVKVADALFDEASVATKLLPPLSPAVAAGIKKVQGVPDVPGKLPVESALQVVATEFPSNEKATVETAAKPVPVAVTRSPTTPLDSLRPTLGSTVNGCVPMLGVGSAESVAVTVWGPAGAASIMNGQTVKLPKASVEHVVVCVTVPEDTVNVTVPSITQPVPLAVSPVVGNVPPADDRVNGGSLLAEGPGEPTRSELLGAIEPSRPEAPEPEPEAGGVTEA